MIESFAGADVLVPIIKHRLNHVSKVFLREPAKSFIADGGVEGHAVNGLLQMHVVTSKG